MEQSSSHKSNLSSLFDDSLNLAAIQTRIINEEQLSPVVLSQPIDTKIGKSKKHCNTEGDNLDQSAEILTGSDSSKTWTESTPSRESNTSKDRLNDVSPIILNEKSCKDDVPTSLEPLLDTPDLKWTSILASPFTCQKPSESLLRTAEREVFCPSNNSRFIVSTNSSKTYDSDSTLNDSKKSDSILLKSEVNAIVSNNSPLLQENTLNTGKDGSIEEEFLVGNKNEETSVVSVKEHSLDFFDNNASPATALTQKVETLDSSPTILQNASSCATPKTCCVKKDIKNKIAMNVVKCLFKKLKDESLTSEEKVEETVRDECEKLQDISVIQKSNFSQFCQDYSTQDFSINTIDQICQASEFEFDSPLSPELSVSYIKDKKPLKLPQARSEKYSEEVSNVSKDADGHSDHDVPHINASLSPKNKSEFLVPSIPPVAASCKIKIYGEHDPELVKVNTNTKKSKLKQLIYMINSSAGKQVIDVSACSEDMLKNAFLFEEDHSCSRSDKISKKRSQQKLDRSSGFVPFSNLITDSSSQVNNKTKDNSSNCRQISLPVTNFKSSRYKTNELLFENISSSDKNVDTSNLMNDSVSCESRVSRSLYTVSDTQMFRIGELIDNVANLSGNPPRTSNESLSGSHISTVRSVKKAVTGKSENTDFKAISSSLLAACDDFHSEMIKTKSPKTKLVDPEMNDSSSSHHLPCNTSGSSKSYFEESYTSESHTTHMKTFSVLDQTITGDIESFNGCDNLYVGKSSGNVDVLPGCKTTFSVAKAVIGTANCDESFKRETCPEIGSSTASEKKVSVSEGALSKAQKFLENCEVSTPDHPSTFAGFSTASGKKVSVSKKALNQARQILEDCDKNFVIKQRSLSEFSTTEDKKDISGEIVLNQSSNFASSCVNEIITEQIASTRPPRAIDENTLKEAHSTRSHNYDTLLSPPKFPQSSKTCANLLFSNNASSNKLQSSSKNYDTSTPVRSDSAVGFSTASRKKVPVSKSALNKARQFLEYNNENTSVRTPCTVVDSAVNIKAGQFPDDGAPIKQSAFNRLATTSDEKISKSGSASIKDSARQILENCNKNTPVKQILTAGYSTASGEKVSVSETALNRAQQSLENCNENTPVKPALIAGFSTASGKKVSVSETALNKAQHFLESCNENTPVKPTLTAGFSTASGKKVPVSETALNRARQSLESCNENTPVKPTLTAGFSTASGKKVSVSETALNRARQLLESCNENTPVKPTLIAGFSTASDKKVSVSETALNKAQHFLESCNENTPVKPTLTAGFSTASGKKVPVSETALNRARQSLESCNENTPAKPTLTAGFSTASGKKVPVSETALNRARQSLESCNENTPVKPTLTAGFSTASGKRVSVSETALNRARQLLESCNENTPVKPTLIAGFSTASGKKVSVSETALNKAQQSLESCNENTPIKPTYAPEFSTSFREKLSAFETTWLPPKNSVDNTLSKTCAANTPLRSSPSLGNTGFLAASGKKVHVSKTAPYKGKQFLQNCDDVTQITQCPPSAACVEAVLMLGKTLNDGQPLREISGSIPVQEITSSGLSTASGKKITVSESALNEARQVLGTCDNFTTVRQITEVDCSIAFGKKVIPENVLNKAQQLFEMCDNSSPMRQASANDFSHAHGKRVSVSEDDLTKARQIVGTSNKDSCVKFFRDPQSAISHKKSSLLYKNLIDTQPEFGVSYGEPSICESVPQKRLKIDNQKFRVSDNVEKSVDNILCNSYIDQPSVQESDTSNSNLKLSENELHLGTVITEKCHKANNAEKLAVFNGSRSSMKEVVDVQSDSGILPNMSPGVAREVSESTAALMIDEENSRSGTDWFSFGGEVVNTTNQVSDLESFFNSYIKDEDDGSTSPEVISRRRNKRKRLKTNEQTKHWNVSEASSPACTSSNCSSFFPLSESGKRGNHNKWVEDLPRSLMFKKGVLHNSTPKMELSKKRNREVDVSPSFRKRLKDCHNNSQEDSPTNEIFLQRLKAAAEQEKFIKFKRKMKNTAQQIGTYLKRKLAKDRISLKRAVLGHRPKIYSEEELHSYGVCEAVIQVTSESASKFRFSAWDHYSDDICEKNTDGVTAGDGAKIILDESGTAGLNEIKRGFLSSPGVDTAIVPEKWVENHYKWIVWKLACMELRFPQIFAKKYLTMNNLLHQLKYRYDREIDKAQRSCLRKILECDEAASKRMILSVVKVIQSNSNVELELTDGWYSVNTVIDAAMMSLIQRKKILVGTKLMIQGAELLNCEQGCDPLEIKENIRLKIHTNCTRRVRWDAKMGFFYDSGPIPVRLDSVLCGGGVVGKLYLFVARVYPMLYLSKTADGKSVFLNEKLENFQQLNEDRERAKQIETLFNEVKKELEEEETKKIPSNRRSFSRKQLSSLKSGQELFEYLETALDPSAVQLTDEQVCALSEYKQKEEERMMQELHSRINERLRNHENAKRNSTPLLKVRVVDGSNPCKNSQSTATLTVWRPSEEVFSFLKEGSFINIYNVLPSSSRFGDISLSANFHTRYEVVSKDLNHPLSRTVSDFSKISEPMFGEVDVIGVVIHIEAAIAGKSHFQKVYLSDLCDNFLAISFSNDVSKFGWGDVIRKNAVVACHNLQWTGGKVSMKIPLLFASEISSFTEKPKVKHAEVALQKFKDDPQLMDLHGFVKSQEDKLFAILEKNTPVKDIKIPNESNINEDDLAALMNESMFAEETISSIKNVPITSGVEQPKIKDSLTPLQEKALRLQYYSPAPSLPKLHMRPTPKLKKEFKVPSKIDQMNQSS